jgi:hypothetical protein
MAMAQKQARNRQEEALIEANKIFASLDTARYQPILPVGVKPDRIGLHDFFSGQSHNFKLFNVRPDEKDALLRKIVDGLNAALVKYDPVAGRKSGFAAVNVTYSAKGGELEFTLKISETVLLAKK